jgi:dTDP-4-dehydrorhamnose reductase
MSHHRLLITGASGFIGGVLINYFMDRGHEVLACYYNSLPTSPGSTQWIHFDVTAPNIEQRILDLRPTAILHCAAVPGISQCDKDRKRAFMVNVDATCRIAETAEKLEIPLVYTSTDLVYDGMRGWYAEDDPPNPTSYYAETKLLGEQKVLSLASRAYVLRLALCYGAGAQGFGGFLKWTYDALRDGNELNLYKNQYRTLLFVDDIPEIIERVLERKAKSGIYHLGGPDRLSRYEIGQQFALKFFGSTRGINQSTLARPAKLGTVDDTSLIVTKIRDEIGYETTGYKQGLDILYRNEVTTESDKRGAE